MYLATDEYRNRTMGKTVLKSKKPKKLPSVDGWVKIKLRRFSMYWPGRSEAIKRARIDRGIYECFDCSKRCKKGEYELDHKIPVIPLDGKIMRDDDRKRLNFNKYIDRLFVGPDGWAVRCKNCHESKTASENLMREFYKKEKK